MRPLVLSFFILGSLLLFSDSLFGQDTTYYSEEGDVALKKEAFSYEVMAYDTGFGSSAHLQRYTITGQLILEAFYSNIDTYELEGHYKEWYPSGTLKKDWKYTKGELNGKMHSYYSNGVIKRDDLYENGKLIWGHTFNEDGAETPYFPAFSHPEYPGGTEKLYKFLGARLMYPGKCRLRKIEGRVLIGFIIGSDGTVSDIKVRRSVHELLDAEAVRVVKLLPKWTPGKSEGKPVAFHYSLPVNFRLSPRSPLITSPSFYQQNPFIFIVFLTL